MWGQKKLQQTKKGKQKNKNKKNGKLALHHKGTTARGRKKDDNERWSKCNC